MADLALNTNAGNGRACVLAHLYGNENAGDFAICCGALDFLLNYFDKVYAISRFKASDAVFISSSRVLNRRYGSRVEVIPGPFTLNRSSKASTLISYAKGAISLAVCSLFLWKRNLVESCDFVFINGGNYLRCESLTDYIRLKPVLFFAKEAQKLDIDYCVLPQSMSGVDKRGKKELIASLKGSKKVFLRESVSYEMAKSYSEFDSSLGIDLAYFMEDRDETGGFELPDGITNPVCFTFRNWKIGDIGQLEESKQKTIVAATLALVEKLFVNKQDVIFVVQTKKDLSFTQSIAQKASKKIPIIEEYDCLKLRGLYKSCQCLIGMRLHSIILASSVGTPVVGYFDQSWGYKNPGTLKDICMPYGFVDDSPDLYSLYVTSKNAQEGMIDAIEGRKSLLIKEFEACVN